MTEQQPNDPTTLVGTDQEFSVLIDLAPELVFEAWRNPVELAKWWAPVDSSTQVSELDVRPGGKIKIKTTTPKQTDCLLEGQFIEVLYPEKLVFVLQTTDAGENRQLQKTIVKFKQELESTRLTLSRSLVGENSAVFPSADFIPGGWNDALSRLSEAMNEIKQAEIDGNPIADSDREIRSTRIFNGPRDLVFSLWTTAAHLAKWWGPTGFTITSSSFEFKPNGVWDFIMHGPDGVDYRNKIRYQQIKAPERIEYEHITGPVHRVIVLFEAQGEETLVHFRMIFATAALRNKVASQFGAVEGLEQTLNRLKELVQKGQKQD